MESVLTVLESYKECSICHCVSPTIELEAFCPIQSCSSSPERRRRWIWERYLELIEHLGKQSKRTIAYLTKYSGEMELGQ
jgi:hypothetical protein